MQPCLSIDKIYQKTCNMIGRIAYALLTNAREYVRNHNIRYQNPPEKKRCPVEKWKKEWLDHGLATMNGSTVTCAFPPDIRDTPYLSVPAISEAMMNAAQQRNQNRKARVPYTRN